MPQTAVQIGSGTVLNIKLRRRKNKNDQNISFWRQQTNEVIGYASTFASLNILQSYVVRRTLEMSDMSYRLNFLMN